MTSNTAIRTDPAQNRAIKAGKLARRAYNDGLTGADLSAMPDNRLASLARLTGVNPPRGRATWQQAGQLIDVEMAAFATAHPGHPAAVRQSPHRRDWWMRPEVCTCRKPCEHGRAGCVCPDCGAEAEEITAPAPPPAELAQMVKESVVGAVTKAWAEASDEPITEAAAAVLVSAAVDTIADALTEAERPLPRGWAELAAQGDLPFGSCVHHPERKPIIFTIDGGRCADCPPRPNEFRVPVYRTLLPGETREDVSKALRGRPLTTAFRDGWGMTLDWTPTHCNDPLPCYCGRCQQAANR